ncbi:MAG: hypothetical protein WC635_06915 [Bacteriovorax sp.]|jgi:hypothetical protein
MNNINKLICIRALMGMYFLYLLLSFFQISELLYLTPDAPSSPSFFFQIVTDQLSQWQVNGIIVLASVASLFFIVGIFQQLCALVMYTSLIVLIHANFLLMEIHYTYLGWMLAVFIFSPRFTNKYQDEDHRISLNWWADKLSTSSLVVFGFSYTFLGIVKLKYSYYYSPLLSDFLFSIPDAHPHNPSYFNFLNNFLRERLGDSAKILLGLSGAWAEAITLPLILFKRTRVVAFTLIFFVLCYISVLINYWNITMVLAIFQLMATDLNSVNYFSNKRIFKILNHF